MLKSDFGRHPALFGAWAALARLAGWGYPARRPGRLQHFAAANVCAHCFACVRVAARHLPPGGGCRYTKLYQRPAGFELPDEDIRQMVYDLETSYNQFMALLKTAGAGHRGS